MKKFTNYKVAAKLLNFFSYLRLFLKISKPSRGMTLIEVLVAFSVLVIVITPLTTVFVLSSKFARINRNKLLAGALAQEKVEVVRNLDYDLVGTDTGWPSGIIPSLEQGIEKGGVSFDIVTDIRYIDDPFDGNVYGTVPDKGVDLYPNDYKKVEIEIYKSGELLSRLTTNVSPSGQETAEGTGIISTEVLDANGDPLQDALVEIDNPDKGISIDITTDIEGKVLVPALPPDNEAYEILVSKGTEFSTDQTYSASAENPNPNKKHLSVTEGELTEASFQIDRLSDLHLKITLASDPQENPISEPINLKMTGAKTIGTDDEGNPIYKYQNTFTVENGTTDLSDLEWDTYSFELCGGSETSFTIVETVPEIPLVLDPGITQTLIIKVEPSGG